MDLRVSYGLGGGLAYPAAPKPQPRVQTAPAAPSDSPSSALIALSPAAPSGQTLKGTRLVSQNEEAIDGGLRRTSTFEQENGRTFTRIEEFTLSNQGARRSVIQQNPSGNITRYDEALDREAGGNFRRTQRFQDEAGDIATTITPNYQVSNPFVLTGGTIGAPLYASSPFDPVRGTQLDLRA